MNYAFCIIMTALLTPLSTFFSACGHDELVPPDVYVEEPPTPYVELLIVIPAVNPSTTRANPIGGEEGNGREHGVLNEDLIHDVNIFFYKGNDGLDGDGETKILHHIYYNIDDIDDPENSRLVDDTRPEFEKNYLNLKFDLAEDFAKLGAGTNFAAIANIGQIQKGDIKKLEDLRELVVSKYSDNAWYKFDPYSVNAATMDYFLMSTAYNENHRYGDENSGYDYTGSNTIEKNGQNYSGTTTLERMYARIDLWYNAKDNAGIEANSEAGVGKSDRLVYAVKDAVDNKDTGNKVYIYNVLPVNVMREPSFLFKKVTSVEPNSWDVTSLRNLTKFKWGGKEYVLDGKPSNYVIEPNTTNKTKTGTGADVDLDKWYKTSKTEQVKTDIKDSEKGKFSLYYSKEQGAAGNDPKDYNCDRVSIISYANENTQGTDCFHPNYLTGLTFRAVYVPSVVAGDYTITKDASGKITETFTPADKDPEVTVIWRFSPSDTYDPENGNIVRESESIYFSNYTACKAYQNAHPEIIGVVSSFTPYWHNEEGEAEGEAKGKWGFLCYYNLWLRHFNDEKADPNEAYPMEYAIVRNNIYRVKIDFTGPGDASPEMREPDTMKARIFVRKWNYRGVDSFFFD